MMKYGILLVLPCPVFPDRLLADGPVRDSLGKGGRMRICRDPAELLGNAGKFSERAVSCSVRAGSG